MSVYQPSAGRIDKTNAYHQLRQNPTPTKPTLSSSSQSPLTSSRSLHSSSLISSASITTNDSSSNNNSRASIPLKINPVNVNIELNEYERRVFTDLELIQSSNESAAIATQQRLQLLDTAFADLLMKYVSAHNNKLSSILKRLWETKNSINMNLIEDLSFNLKQSSFLWNEKTRELERYKKECEKYLLSSEENNDNRCGFDTPSESLSMQQIVSDLSIRQQLEYELNVKNTELLHLESKLSRLAVWFPNFEEYGSSFLTRMLPPFASPEQKQLIDNNEAQAKEAFFYDDEKVPIKKNLLMAKTKLFFQADRKKLLSKHPSLSLENKNGNDSNEEDEEEADESDGEFDLIEQASQPNANNNYIGPRAIKLAQWYLMKDIRRLEDLGIGLTMGLKLPDTIGRHINVGHTSEAPTSKRDKYMMSIINMGSVATSPRASAINSQSIAADTYYHNSTDNSAKVLSDAAASAASGVDESDITTLIPSSVALKAVIQQYEAELESAEEAERNLTTQNILLEKKLVQAEEKFQLSIMETQLLEKEIIKLNKDHSYVKRVWKEQRNSLRSELNKLTRKNKQLTALNRSIVKENLLNNQLLPFQFESESLIKDSSELWLGLSKRISSLLPNSITNKDEVDSDNEDSEVLKVTNKSFCVPTLRCIRVVDLVTLLLHSSLKLIRSCSRVVESTHFKAVYGIKPFILDKNLFVCDKGILCFPSQHITVGNNRKTVVSNNINNNIVKAQEELAVCLQQLFGHSSSTGPFVDMLRQFLLQTMTAPEALCKINHIQFSIHKYCAECEIHPLRPLPPMTKLSDRFWPPAKPLQQQMEKQLDVPNPTAGPCSGPAVQELTALLNIRFDELAPTQPSSSQSKIQSLPPHHQQQRRELFASSISMTLEDSSTVLALRILQELIGVGPDLGSSDLSGFRYEGSNVLTAVASWSGISRREAFFNVFIKLVNILKHTLLPSITSIALSEGFDCIANLLHILQAEDNNDNSISGVCPWWFLLPATMFEQLKADISMCRLPTTIATGAVIHPFELILFTWNAILRLQSRLQDILQQYFAFACRIIGIFGCGNECFQQIFFHVLQSNAHRTNLFGSVFSEAQEDNYRLDEDSNLPPSAVHPQLGSELTSLDCKYKTLRYFDGNNNNSSAENGKENIAKEFASLVLATRSPLLVLSFLDVLDHVYAAPLEASFAIDRSHQHHILTSADIGNKFWEETLAKGVQLRSQLDCIICRLRCKPTVDGSLEAAMAQVTTTGAIKAVFYDDDQAAIKSAFKRNILINKCASVDLSFELEKHRTDQSLARCFQDSRPSSQTSSSPPPSSAVAETAETARSGSMRPKVHGLWRSTSSLLEACTNALLLSEPILCTKFHQISPPSKIDILLAMKVLAGLVSFAESQLRVVSRILGRDGNGNHNNSSSVQFTDVETGEDGVPIVDICCALDHRNNFIKRKYFRLWNVFIDRN